MKTIRDMPLTPKGRDNHDRIFKKAEKLCGFPHNGGCGTCMELQCIENSKEITYQESLDMATVNVGNWPNFLKVGLQTAPEREILCPDCGSISYSPVIPYGVIISYICNTCGTIYE